MLGRCAFRLLAKAGNVWHRLKTRLWYGLFFQHIGPGSVIRNPLFIANPDRISIGSRVFFRDGVRIEVVGDGSIIIGDYSSFEQNFHITSGGELRIGNYVVATYGGMITNIDHSYQNINIGVLGQPNIVSSTVIGDFCFLGAGAKIQAGTVLGKQCIVGANAVVRGEYPDYCVLVGVPARVIKRYNPASGQWERTMPDGGFIVSSS